ncbi:hypothetical protein ACWEV4_00310 [Streptomyces sp. NPDC003860]
MTEGASGAVLSAGGVGAAPLPPGGGAAALRATGSVRRCTGLAVVKDRGPGKGRTSGGDAETAGAAEDDCVAAEAGCVAEGRVGTASASDANADDDGAGVGDAAV